MAIKIFTQYAPASPGCFAVSAQYYDNTNERSNIVAFEFNYDPANSVSSILNAMKNEVIVRVNQDNADLGGTTAASSDVFGL